jgi:hypothetical protein
MAINDAVLIGTRLVIQLNGRTLDLANDVDLGEACEIMLDLAKHSGRPFPVPVRKKLVVRKRSQVGWPK